MKGINFKVEENSAEEKHWLQMATSDALRIDYAQLRAVVLERDDPDARAAACQSVASADTMEAEGARQNNE